MAIGALSGWAKSFADGLQAPVVPVSPTVPPSRAPAPALNVAPEVVVATFTGTVSAPVVTKPAVNPRKPAPPNHKISWASRHPRNHVVAHVKLHVHDHVRK
jgi:hypothetical protein